MKLDTASQDGTVLMRVLVHPSTVLQLCGRQIEVSDWPVLHQVSQPRLAA